MSDYDMDRDVDEHQMTHIPPRLLSPAEARQVRLGWAAWRDEHADYDGEWTCTCPECESAREYVLPLSARGYRSWRTSTSGACRTMQIMTSLQPRSET
jgi:hypothetical protein